MLEHQINFQTSAKYISLILFRLEILENLVCTLKNEINRYLLIISDMEKLNRECEQFIQKCRLMSEECQKHQSELEEITTTLAQK